MQDPKAPDQVGLWAANPPAWLEIRTVASFTPFEDLGRGESEAIALARQIHADQVLIDDREAVTIARQLGLSVVGTLGVLELAAKKGLISFQDAISALGRTTFRAPERLIAELLERDKARKGKPSDSDNRV
jgi:predicted nucleic acid-binding protein